MTMIRTGDGFVIDNDNPLPIRLQDSAITLQTDKQNNLATTIQTHNAVSIPLSSNSAGSWIDTDGFSELCVTVMNDAAQPTSVNVEFSNDGTTYQGLQIFSSVTSTGSSRGSLRVETRARYARINIYNNDSAIAHTISAWAYLKA